MINPDNKDSISLNKYLSERGICSRREADVLIESGRVKLNGEVAQKGNRVETGDEVRLDDKVISKKQRPVYIAFNKPKGIVCTTDKREKDNIIDFIGYRDRIFPIGRLDKDSEGLILLTNDGDIVNKILRSSNRHEKEYVVKVDRLIDREFVTRMEGGIPILDTVTKKCKVKKLDDRTFKIILTQGLNRQIRRMCEYLGYNVVSLKRIRIMHIHLGTLRKSKWRYLKENELDKLLKSTKQSRK